MADVKITALPVLTAADPINDAVPIVDVSDNTITASGTTKRISINNILGASGTATLASATITGDLTVDTSTLKVDSTNNRVGIGTATPGSPLDVRFATNPAINNAVPTNALRVFTSVAQAVDVGGQIGLGGLFDATQFQAFGNISGKKENSTSGNNAGYLVVGTCDSGGTMAERYRIDSTGISTWSVAGTTAMTLNSTGLTMATGSLNSQYWYGINATSIVSSGSGSWPLLFGINGSEKMRLDASGNLGIGVTPSAWGAGTSVIDMNTGGNAAGVSSSGTLSIASNAFFGSAWTYKRTASALLYQLISGTHSWFTAASGTINTTITDFATAKMTLDASGNLLVGATAQTSNEMLRVNSVTSTTWAVAMTSVNRGWLNRQSDASGGIAALFEVGASNTNVGSITTTAVATAYNIASDYRLKESVQPLAGGLARISALKPSIYKWKVNGSNGEGFLAHELADVVPAAVTGEKDAVDADGKPTYQGVDLSKIVPILVAAIQELTAEVNALKNA